MEFEKTLRMNTLFAFYGPLLTNKQREYMKLYFADNYSLGEIAEAFEVSRQAVYDNINRSESILNDYEEKLQIVDEFEKRQRALNNLRDYVEQEYKEDEKLRILIEKITLESQNK